MNKGLMGGNGAGDDPFSVRGKTIFVAGGTRGIGQAVSIHLARAGASVIANYLRNEQSAERLKAIAAEENLQVSFCRADLTTDKGLERVCESLQGSGSALSGLVYCAATGVHRPLGELTDRHFDFTFGLNVRAFMKLVQLLKPRFIEGSSIVALSSWGATRAIPHYTLVGASKGALESLARHLAAELAPAGVRVNILTAGAVLTDVWKAIPNSDERLAETIRRTPTGRLVTPEEVACGVRFLCSDAASAVIGQTLILDGGAGILA
jgi:enoyl-[acyl-carrier protein] reductase III